MKVGNLLNIHTRYLMSSTQKNSISNQPVKGMRDVFPEDMAIRNWLFSQWRAVSQSFGFTEYDSAIVESEDLYIRKAGDDITKELYNFTDKGNRKIALRPEMTPTLARMIISKGQSLPLPVRWFAIPQCFRYQRMQKGRKREHFQWNMDIVGLSSTIAEAELMTAQYEFLKRVGFVVDGDNPQISFRVSNRLVLESFLAEIDIVGDAFAQTCINIDKRDKIGDEATHKLLIKQGIDAERAHKILALISITGIDELRDFVGADNPGYRSLVALLEYAESFGIANVINIDLSVVRGLSYYTGTVWELFDTAGSLPRAIAGGGRYDKLLESLGGNPTPMVGFGFGDVVITLLLEERGLLPKKAATVTDVVYPMSESEFILANQLAHTLRKQNKSVLVDYTTRRFKAIMKNADRQGAHTVWIIGEQEREKYVVRKKTLGGEQVEINLNTLLSQKD
jgi:histidyl-tRNA synthetase